MFRSLYHILPVAVKFPATYHISALHKASTDYSFVRALAHVLDTDFCFPFAWGDVKAQSSQSSWTCGCPVKSFKSTHPHAQAIPITNTARNLLPCKESRSIFQYIHVRRIVRNVQRTTRRVIHVGGILHLCVLYGYMTPKIGWSAERRIWVRSWTQFFSLLFILERKLTSFYRSLFVGSEVRKVYDTVP